MALLALCGPQRTRERSIGSQSATTICPAVLRFLRPRSLIDKQTSARSKALLSVAECRERNGELDGRQRNDRG